MERYERIKFVEMATARKEILHYCMGLQPTINEHLLKILTLSMGDLDYSQMIDNWRWEIANNIAYIQNQKWRGGNSKYLSWKDYYLKLFIEPFTYSSRVEPNPEPDLESIQTRIQGIIDDYEFKSKTSKKIPLHFEFPDDLKVTYDMLDVLHQSISKALERGLLLNRGDIVEMLKNSGF